MRAYFFSPVVSGVEWLFAWPDNGIEEDSSFDDNSFGWAWVGPLALPPLLAAWSAGGAAGICASEGGNVFAGAATEPEVVLPLSAGAGVSAFLQPVNTIARKAHTRTGWV